MKTENRNMKIMEPENTTEGREVRGMKYKLIQPVVLDTIPEDAVFVCSIDICELLNISDSTLGNLRVERTIPSYKLGGIFLYNEEETTNYLTSNYNRRI